MSVAEPIPEEIQHTFGIREKGDDQKFLDELEILEHDCMDCCRLKIDRFKIFEKEIKAKTELLWKYRDHHYDTEDRCTSLVTCAQWTKETLDVLQRNLRKLYEKSGLPLPPEESDQPAADLKDIISQMTEMVVKHDLIDPPGDVEGTYILPESLELDSGIYFYKNSKFKDYARKLIVDMQDAEVHKMDAEAKGMPISVSKGYIEKQIELAKKLPVSELVGELEELIAGISPVKERRSIVPQARQLISRICFVVMREKKEFWKRYEKRCSSTSEGEEKPLHSLNGIEQTLDLLLYEVDKFNNQWNEKYAPLFNIFDDGLPRIRPSDDRSDPIRPCVDQPDSEKYRTAY